MPLVSRMLMAASYVASGASGAPAAPSALAVQADGGYQRALLTWTVNSVDEDGFKVERSLDGTTGWTEIADIGGGRDWYNDASVTRGTEYFYRVNAYNGAGSSSYTSVESATIFALSDIACRVILDAAAGTWQNTAGSTPADADGEKVRRWDNAGTLGGTFDAPDDAHRPTWKADEGNGVPSLFFDYNIGYWLESSLAASNWKFLHDGSGYSIVMAWQAPRSAPVGALPLLTTANDSTSSTGLDIQFLGTGFSQVYSIDAGIFKGSGSAHAAAGTRDETVSPVLWHVTAARYDSSLGATAFQIDNDGQFGGSAASGLSGTASSSDPASPLRIGINPAASLFLDGNIAFIAITSAALSDADYQTLQEYVAEEYAGLTLKFFEDSELLTEGTGTYDHCAFPGFCIAQNGDYVAAYARASSHVAFDGKLMVKRSTDKGATWGSEITVFDYATDGGGVEMWTAPSLTVLPDGRIFMAAGKEESAQPADIGYFLSSDHGATWGSAVEIDGTLSEWEAEGGGLLVLDNGDLAYPFYGKNTGSATWFNCLLVSDDDLATWDFISTIASGAAGTSEVGLLENSAGLTAVYRTTTASNAKASTDDGATWSSAIYVVGAFGLNRILKLNDKEAIICLRDLAASSYEAVIVYTNDRGSHWQKGYRFPMSPANATRYSMVYGQFAQEPNGRLALVYAVENAASAAADVLFSSTAR